MFFKRNVLLLIAMTVGSLNAAAVSNSDLNGVADLRYNTAKRSHEEMLKYNAIEPDMAVTQEMREYSSDIPHAASVYKSNSFPFLPVVNDLVGVPRTLQVAVNPKSQVKEYFVQPQQHSFNYYHQDTANGNNQAYQQSIQFNRLNQLSNDNKSYDYVVINKLRRKLQYLINLLKLLINLHDPVILKLLSNPAAIELLASKNKELNNQNFESSTYKVVHLILNDAAANYAKPTPRIRLLVAKSVADKNAYPTILKKRQDDNNNDSSNSDDDSSSSLDKIEKRQDKESSPSSVMYDDVSNAKRDENSDENNFDNSRNDENNE